MAVFRAPSAREMAATARIVLTKMKTYQDGMQLMDDCVDLFTAVPNLANNDKNSNLSQRFNLLRTNVAADSPLAILVNLGSVSCSILTPWLLNERYLITTYSETTNGCPCRCRV